jgi:uncharacterized protein (DUF488 family)
MGLTVYTVGHSTHSIERFIELLTSTHVEAVSDVRSRPYSRMNPQFNREPLEKVLCGVGIKYVFLGKHLGARSEDRSCYYNGQVQYDLLANTELFKKGIERIREGAQKYQIALMCAEKDPLDCHRAILVARKLLEQGLTIKHILADGSIEDHAQAMERLIAQLGVPRADMFRSEEEAVTEAYARRGREIAYREEIPAASSAGLGHDAEPAQAAE